MYTDFCSLECLFIHIYAPTHIMTESTEPAGAASPIGNKVSAYNFDARYEPGTLTNTIDKILCTKPM